MMSIWRFAMLKTNLSPLRTSDSVTQSTTQQGRNGVKLGRVTLLTFSKIRVICHLYKSLELTMLSLSVAAVIPGNPSVFGLGCPPDFAKSFPIVVMIFLAAQMHAVTIFVSAHKMQCMSGAFPLSASSL